MWAFDDKFEIIFPYFSIKIMFFFMDKYGKFSSNALLTFFSVFVCKV